MARKKRGIPVHGWLNIDKPAGRSSAQVVGAVKRITNAQKVGHAGTLDPFATGVLPIALGEATKTVSYMMAEEKSYRFTVVWGEARNTDDIEGEVTDHSDIRPDRNAIEAVIPIFTGEQVQTPPAFSAIKINGQRAYKLARAGIEVDIPKRTVMIHSLKLVKIIDSESAIFDVVCGKGTYIRALARDISRYLGTFGHLSALRRTKVGSFLAQNAISLDKLEQLWQCPAEFGHLLPISTALDDIPELAVTGPQADRLKHGNSLSGIEFADGIVCAIYGDTPIALSKVENGWMYPVRVFNIDNQE
jgi:tRNA pseudouridine55 synthase